VKELLDEYVVEAKKICKRVYRRARYRLHGALHETVTVPTQQGLLTMLAKDDVLAAAIYRERQYEYDFSVRALELLKESGFIPASNVAMLDVGANIGIISIGLLLSEHVDFAFAIEPEPRNFGLLQRNVEQNRLSERVICLRMALGVDASLVNMELSSDNSGDHRIRETPRPGASESMGESERRTIQVESLPLTQMLGLPEVRNSGLPAPSLLWIDIQGYEGYVFRGGSDWLSRGVPAVSEVWPYGILRAGMPLETYAEIVAGIWTDYWVERRNRFTRYPITVFDRYLEELGTEGYVENVIFSGSHSGTTQAIGKPKE
jgi:FkbM family methyltransferase